MWIFYSQLAFNTTLWLWMKLWGISAGACGCRESTDSERLRFCRLSCIAFIGSVKTVTHFSWALLLQPLNPKRPNLATWICGENALCCHQMITFSVKVLFVMKYVWCSGMLCEPACTATYIIPDCLLRLQLRRQAPRKANCFSFSLFGPYWRGVTLILILAFVCAVWGCSFCDDRRAVCARWFVYQSWGWCSLIVCNITKRNISFEKNEGIGHWSIANLL